MTSRLPSKLIAAVVAVLVMSGGLLPGLADAKDKPKARAAAAELPVSGKIFLVPNSSDAYVTLNGEGALRLYTAMAAKPRADACREGRKIKWVGNLSCSLAKDGKSADCDFGLNHRTGKLSPGQPC